MKTTMIKYICAMLLVGAYAVSCTLIESPVTESDRKTVFSSENGIAAYSYSLYSMLPSLDNVFYSESSHVDYCAANSYWDFYVDGTYNPEQTTSWSWSGLRRVNYFIDALKSEDCTVDEDIKEHYIALGYWFRAWFYFDKLRSYGDVPWFEHVISSTDEATMYKDRDPRDLIVKNLIRDLDYCYEHLKTEESVGNSLVSKYAALLLKARICLYEASWKKYHNLEDLYYTSDELYGLAASTANMIIQSGKFSLNTTTFNNGQNEVGAYRAVFHSEAVIEEEVIMGLCTDPAYGVYSSANRHFNSNYGNGDCMSRAFVHTYLNLDGTPFTSKPNYSTVLFKDEFTGRDQRMIQTLKFPEYRSVGASHADLVPDILHQNAVTGYQIIKFTLDNTTYNDSSDGTNSIPLMRYAEALLIYAEAKAELGTITHSDWANTIGLLRARAGITAGLKNLPTTIDTYLQQTFYPTVTDPVILEIRRERAIELFFEGFRTSDLDRWAEGHLIEDLPWTGIHIPALDTPVDVRGKGRDELYFSEKPLAQIPAAYKDIYVQILPEDSSTQGLRAIPNPAGGFDLEYRLAVPRIWHDDDRQYLDPVPPQIIREYAARGYSLSQNPGW